MWSNNYKKPLVLEFNNDHEIIKFCEKIYNDFNSVIQTNECTNECEYLSLCLPSHKNKNNNYWQNYYVQDEIIKDSYTYITLFKSNYIFCDHIDNDINIITKLMFDNGFNVIMSPTCDEKLIELHVAKSENNIVKSPFEIHTDDYGGVDYKVCTLICYLENTSEGGELAFYDDIAKKELLKIETSSKSLSKKIIIFNGNINHMALPILNGQRIAVSIQIKRH